MSVGMHGKIAMTLAASAPRHLRPPPLPVRIRAGPECAPRPWFSEVGALSAELGQMTPLAHLARAT
eukprot:2550477-Pyramimonas_sp.AAC.1